MCNGKRKANRTELVRLRLRVFDGRDFGEIKLVVFWDLPGVPVVKTLSSQCRGHSFNPGLGP